MSASVRVQADDRNIELGSAVNWPLIIAGAGFALTVLIAVVVLALAAPAAPKPQSVVAQKTVVPAPEPDIIWPANREPRLEPREAPPQPVVVGTTPKPAMPQKPKLPSKPAVVVSKSVPKPAAPVVEATSQPLEPAPVVQQTFAQSFKRRFPYGEEELRERLNKDSRELDIETEKGTTAKLLTETAKPTKAPSTDKTDAKPQTKMPPIVELIAKRDDLRGLPVRDLDKCQVPAKEAKIMAGMSGTVRAAMAKLSRRSTSSSYSEAWKYREDIVDHLGKCLKGREWNEDVGVRMMTQMFQIEDEIVRTKMISILIANKEKSASAALAQRAVYDLHPDVRLSAVAALKDRLPKEYRSVLLDALRYPWSPVADNAAEALVALNDREAIPDLVKLLDKPDPQAPTQNKDKKWVAPELVRVNHLGNCVLCHAPCSAKEDTVRGLVPERGKPLPVVYYESREGNFVRADVTYLKQDFSVMQLVEKPGKWPAVQRFDYLIRQRELSADEVKRLPQSKESGAEYPMYPQREAVLWALRELSGVNIGPRSEDWDHYVQYRQRERMKREP